MAATYSSISIRNPYKQIYTICHHKLHKCVTLPKHVTTSICLHFVQKLSIELEAKIEAKNAYQFVSQIKEFQRAQILHRLSEQRRKDSMFVDNFEKSCLFVIEI